jgi:Fic/DOC family
MLGSSRFHPFARRSLLGTTTSVKESLESRTSEMCLDARRRAASYMRYKETQSTFAIEQEGEKVNEAKMRCRLLRQVDKLSLDTKEGTLKVSGMLFPDDAEEYACWRKSEIFIGSSKVNKKGVRSETIYYIGAKYADLESLMTAFYATLSDCQRFVTTDFADVSHDLLQHNKRHFDPVSIIAILTFSFTLIHPLPDGNGRTHRLLIHYLLEKFAVLDSWLVPVSVIILHDNQRTCAKDKILKGF